MFRHHSLLVALLPVTLIILFACADDVPSADQVTESPAAIVFDSILAAELGADDYGMKAYVMAFLKNGPNRRQDSTEAAQLQRAHLDNITRLADEGKLVLAGPFLDGGDIRGIYVFDVRTLEEARALTATDPAIQAGRLVMDLHPWYGSATLPLVYEWHEKIARLKI
jgi:uncharacterized protein YciI